jgi:hypothetical protein
MTPRVTTRNDLAAGKDRPGVPPSQAGRAQMPVVERG